jgi:hypothetical protein
LSKWPRDNYVGFVDESGDMREGEPHVIAGLVFREQYLAFVDSLGKRLMAMTPPLSPREPGGRLKWPKAEMLSKEGLELCAKELTNLGITFLRVKKVCDTETRAEAAKDMTSAVDDHLEPLLKLLSYADQRDLRVHIALKHFREEATRHPFYFQLVKDWLRRIARDFHARRCAPFLTLCFDFKFQWASRDLLNLLVRGQFYTTFAGVLDFSLAHIFGLGSSVDFVAKIGTDPKEACLYIADIYAHANGCVVKGRDSDGRQQRFLDALGPVTEV